MEMLYGAVTATAGTSTLSGDWIYDADVFVPAVIAENHPEARNPSRYEGRITKSSRPPKFCKFTHCWIRDNIPWRQSVRSLECVRLLSVESAAAAVSYQLQGICLLDLSRVGRWGIIASRSNAKGFPAPLK